MTRTPGLWEHEQLTPCLPVSNGASAQHRTATRSGLRFHDARAARDPGRDNLSTRLRGDKDAPGESHITGQCRNVASDTVADQPAHDGAGVTRGAMMEQSSHLSSSAEAQGLPLSLEELKQRLAVQVARCPRPHTRYDTPLSPPRWTDPKQRGEWHQSLQWVVENQRAMLLGHLDAQGVRWCWRCYHRACLVDLGERLAYPRIARSLLALLEQNWLEEVCPQSERAEQAGIVGYQGRVAWIAVAVHGPAQVVADILRVFRTPLSAK